jgi:hypothetical protein
MPHTFKALMQKDSILDEIGEVSTNDSDYNGCHIHISRTAFQDDKHYSLFYFLLHKMVDISTIVGGRDLTDYCSLAPAGKVHSKKKVGGVINSNRAVYLNERNSPTIEARFFKSTTNTSRLKVYVQYLESVIKYTKYHTKRVSADRWFEYITKKSKKYKELLTFLEENKDKIVTDNKVVVHKTPKIKGASFNKLSTEQLFKVTLLHLTGDKVVEVEKIKYIIYDSRELVFTKPNYGEDRVQITEILKVVYEED